MIAHSCHIFTYVCIYFRQVRVDAVPNVVVDTSGQALLTSSGQQTIPSWGRGSFYQDDSGVNTFAADYLPNIVKDPSLLDAQGKFFAKSRPQYETLPADEFASVKGTFTKFIN